MRIIRSKAEVDKFKENARIANEGCGACPGCGETGSLHVAKDGITGIDSHSYTWQVGFLNTKHMKVDRYSCYTCGCKWESEPYEYM